MRMKTVGLLSNQRGCDEIVLPFPGLYFLHEPLHKLRNEHFEARCNRVKSSFALYSGYSMKPGSVCLFQALSGVRGVGTHVFLLIKTNQRQIKKFIMRGSAKTKIFYLHGFSLELIAHPSRIVCSFFAFFESLNCANQTQIGFGVSKSHDKMSD